MGAARQDGGWKGLFARLRGEALRYILIQLLAYGIEFGVFWLVLRGGGAPVAAANVAGKVAAGLFAFLAHRAWTFPGPQRRGPLAQAALYAGSLALNAGLATLLLLGLLRLDLAEAPAKLLADLGMIALTFLVSRQLIFARRGRAP